MERIRRRKGWRKRSIKDSSTNHRASKVSMRYMTSRSVGLWAKWCSKFRKVRHNFRFSNLLHRTILLLLRLLILPIPNLRPNRVIVIPLSTLFPVTFLHSIRDSARLSPRSRTPKLSPTALSSSSLSSSTSSHSVQRHRDGGRASVGFVATTSSQADEEEEEEAISYLSRNTTIRWIRA